MKKHHSIFGTKSVPGYKKKEFHEKHTKRKDASVSKSVASKKTVNYKKEKAFDIESETLEPEHLNGILDAVESAGARQVEVQKDKYIEQASMTLGVANDEEIDEMLETSGLDDFEGNFDKTYDDLHFPDENVKETYQEDYEDTENYEDNDEIYDLDNSDEFDEQKEDSYEEDLYDEYESESAQDDIYEDDSYEEESAQDDRYEDLIDDDKYYEDESYESNDYEEIHENVNSPKDSFSDNENYDFEDDFDNTFSFVEKDDYDDLLRPSELNNKVSSKVKRGQEKSFSSKSVVNNDKKSDTREKAVPVSGNRKSSGSYKNRRKAASSSRKMKKSFLANKTSLERVSLVIGLLIVIMIVTMGSVFIQSRAKANEIASFGNIGSQVEGLTMIGEDGLVAVSDAQAAKKMVVDNTAQEASSAATESTTAEEEKGVNVKMTLSSIKQDLKIKFINAKTSRLVSKVPFEVEVSYPDGKVSNWKDENTDGIIYHYDIPSGNYKVTLKPLDADKYADYTIDTKPQTINVKETIAYQEVDVHDEVKTEAEVNVAKEDTQVQKTVVESVNKDTVEWVESTKTEIGSNGTVSYEEVNKSNIKDPNSSMIINSKIKKMSAVDNALPTETTDNNSQQTDTPAPSTENNGTENGEGNNSGKENTNSSSGGNNSGTGETNNSSAGGTTSSSTGGTSNASTGGTTSSSTGGTTKHEVKEYEYKVSESGVTIEAGKTHKISASTTDPKNNVSFSSSDNSIATVAADGTITAIKAGTATITATFNGGITRTCTVKVTASSSSASTASTQGKDSLKLSASSIKVGETITATATTDLKDKTVVWATSDPSVVEIKPNGLTAAIRGLKQGAAKITVRFADKTEKTLQITVTNSNVKLEITSQKSVLLAGKTLQLKVKVTGAKTANVKWASSDASIAQVNEKGLVTALKAGTVDIVASLVEDANVNAKCTITVKDGTAPLTTKDGRTVYVSDGNGGFRPATTADYDTAKKFFVQTEGKNYKYTGWQTIDGYTYYFDKNGNPVTGEQVIQGAKYTFGSDGRLSNGSGVLGIDVSKWNGNIDWSQVKNSGVSYVIIRCGYRGSSSGALIQDPKFRANINGATSAGLKVGVYFFTQATSDVEAVEEASMVLELVKGHSLPCGVYLDVEGSGGRADSISTATRTAVCKAFCATIANRGYRTGIYANKTWLSSRISTSSLTGYKIWLAQYRATPTYTATRYDMWQYTSSGSVRGISGRVDMNISYMNF